MHLFAFLGGKIKVTFSFTFSKCSAVDTLSQDLFCVDPSTPKQRTELKAITGNARIISFSVASYWKEDLPFV